MQENVSSIDKKRTDRHQVSPQICDHLRRITSILPADGPKMSQGPFSRNGRQIQRMIDTNAVMPKVTGSKNAATMTSDMPTAVRKTGQKCHERLRATVRDPQRVHGAPCDWRTHSSEKAKMLCVLPTMLLPIELPRTRTKPLCWNKRCIALYLMSSLQEKQTVRRIHLGNVSLSVNIFYKNCCVPQNYCQHLTEKMCILQIWRNSSSQSCPPLARMAAS